MSRFFLRNRNLIFVTLKAAVVYNNDGLNHLTIESVLILFAFAIFDGTQMQQFPQNVTNWYAKKSFVDDDSFCWHGSVSSVDRYHLLLLLFRSLAIGCIACEK